MIWQRTRFALLACSVLAVFALMARADEEKKDDKKDEKKPEKVDAPKEDPTKAPPGYAPGHGVGYGGGYGGGDCGGPSYRTVYVTEYRSETYEATRTVYRSESRQEAYTAYREECVPEQRTRTCTVYHRVPECKDVVVCKWVDQPCVETRTVYNKVTKCVPCTTVHRKCVDKGHWETQCYDAGPSLMDRMRKSLKNDCCCEEYCPRMKSKRVWVSCMVVEECPVTTYKHVTECIPCTVQVTVCKKVPVHETVKVTTWKCVPECRTENYTVMVKRCVPYQATRCVTVCVPHCEKYLATRCVPVCVAKQVPVCNPCECATTCCEESKGGWLRGMFARRGHGHGGGCGCD
jgi:hypothetical protein